MLRGLSAFPLTPITNNNVDEAAFVHLITNLVAAGVDSIGAVGSTGSYAYLTRDERRRVTELAVQHAEGIPVLVSIGAIRLDDVLAIAEDAQRAGVKAVMMAPVSYQRLNAEEVYTLYDTVTRHLSVPLCLYDNPATTGFAFTDDLLVEIAALPAVCSIKLSAVSTDPTKGKERIDDLRARIPASVTIGISGDWQAATGFAAGCDVWYSVIGGLFPQVSLAHPRRAGGESSPCRRTVRPTGTAVAAVSYSPQPAGDGGSGGNPGRGRPFLSAFSSAPTGRRRQRAPARGPQVYRPGVAVTGRPVRRSARLVPSLVIPSLRPYFYPVKKDADTLRCWTTK
jgi:4-hydroxy-tetrahydrodipicolinate synthase